jgi:hypothetical protein
MANAREKKKTQVYGIWGDTNGDDGDEAMVGEASISLATACFGSKSRACTHTVVTTILTRRPE